MYALVVDGFPDDERGRHRFNELVRDNLSSMGEKIAVQVRRLNGLESYLFLPDEGYRNNNGAHNFDKVDLLFVDGDPNLLPWHPHLDQIRGLLKMCLLTNKCVFACSFAMQLIAYICSTGGSKLHIVDDLYRGGNVDMLKSKAIGDPYAVHQGSFVDNYTGDIYRFDQRASVHNQKGVWIPKMNAGMRLRRAMGKKRRNMFRVNPLNVDFYDETSETSVRIESIYVQHWLFKGTHKQQFIVGSLNEWDVIRPTVVGAKNGSFTTLAESPCGPQIIECGNIIGVQFHLSERYEDTLPLMGNYIRHMFTQMQSLGTICLSASSLRSELSILTAERKLGYSSLSFQDKIPAVKSFSGNVSVARGFANSTTSLNKREPSNSELNISQSALALAIRPTLERSKFTKTFMGNSSSIMSLPKFQREKLSETQIESGYNGPSYLSESLSRIPYDVSHSVDWSVWHDAKNDDGIPLLKTLPSFGYTKKDIRQFLHPSTSLPRIGEINGSDENSKKKSVEDDDIRAEPLPLGLESKPRAPVRHVVNKNSRPFCSFNKHVRIQKEWESKNYYERQGYSSEDLSKALDRPKAQITSIPPKRVFDDD